MNHDQEVVIEIRNLSKKYGHSVIHRHLNLTIYRGEIIALVGGSGSGKTTLLRQMIGLEMPTSGSIDCLGLDIYKLRQHNEKIWRQRIGVLFQQGALFSSLNTFDNIAQPIRELGKIREDFLSDLVLLKLKMVGLAEEDAYKMPADLSGGMIKRVGIARALALEPGLLFLDEPTAGLDPVSAEQFVKLIAMLHDMLGLTVVMITHDLETVVALSTRVAILADQHIIACAPVEEVVHVDNPFVREYFWGARGRLALQGLPKDRRSKLPEGCLLKQ